MQQEGIRWLCAWTGAIATSLACAIGAAHAYPAKPVSIIVPVAPGGGTDFAARQLADGLSTILKQTVIVENRPGASGNLGLSTAAAAAPDGHTLVMPITSFPINPALYAKLPFDTEKDFTPIALVGSFPLLLVVNPALPAKSAQELIRLAREQPGRIHFANSGNGTTAHLAGELFKRAAGVDIASVPYRGGGPAITDLLGGHVQMYFSTIPAALPHVTAGKLRALAVTGSQRSAELPDVPTLSEAGLAGFDVTAWFGLFAPAGTPQDIIDTLHRATQAVLAREEVRGKLMSHGFIPPESAMSLQDMRQFVAQDIARWRQRVAQIGVRLD